MPTTTKHPSTATSNQGDKTGAEGTGRVGQGQQKRGWEQATKPPGTKSTGRSISSAKNITSYLLEKQQVSSPSTRRNKKVTEEELKMDEEGDGRKLQASLSRAQAALNNVVKHRESSLKTDQEAPSTSPPKAAEATKSNLENQGEETVETEGNMPTPEKTAPEEPKSDNDPTGSQKGPPSQDGSEVDEAKLRKNKKKKKKKNMKQSSVVESGEDGQGNLAGSPKKKSTKEKSNKEVVKDAKYWAAYEQERRRANSFRCNFTFHMETPQEGEDRTKMALKLLRQTANVMGVLDESLVLRPWFELQHVSISPSIKATEIVPSTNMKTYCRKIYDNKRKPGNAKIEISVSTDLDQEEWLMMMGNYLNGQHHTRVYMNSTKGPNSVNIGFGVMSTPSSNLQAMGHRLSQASGINIGCRGGKVVLPGEDNKNESVGYAPGLGVQAVQFYSDQADKDEATSYLNNLLKGKYTNEQMLLCPIMKFCVKPGILTGGNHAKDNAKMRKHQDHFLQNISKMEMITPITSSLDAIVKIKTGRVSDRKPYTLRQMLMMVKNPNPATSEASPYLLYDVDRVGSSKSMRFIYFKLLKKQIIRAAENILALLQRNFSSAYDFEEHFTLDAIVEARRHPWSNDHGGFAQGKPKTGSVDPRTMLIMCKNNNSDASSCSEIESSDEEDDEDEEEKERSRGYLPTSVRNQSAPEQSILRRNLRHKGLHPPGPTGKDEQEKISK